MNNRFRANLHPAFFDPDKLEKTINEPQTKEQLETKRQVDAVKKDVIDSAKNNPEPRKVTIDDIMDVTIMENLRFNGIDNPEQFLIDNPQFSSVNNPEFKSKRRQRFQERLDTYGDKWNKDIEEWYKQLMKSLEENHYFEGSNGERDDLAIAQVQGRYRSAVINKYIDEVLGVWEKKFNKSDRSDIFNRRLEDSIVNKIYTKLTGAASISTVERQFTESYVPTTSLEASEEEGKTPPAGTWESPAAEKTWETDESALEETEINKNNRKFLSNDLPQYLRNIRKTPWILNVMRWLPVFSVTTDRPSEVDRDAISDFLKAANRIPTKDGKLPEMVLIEALHDNTLNKNSSIDTYQDVLEKHWMDKSALINRGYKQFRKCLSKIRKVGDFYINTQKANNDVKDQHAIYLSVLGIIENEKWAENAVNRFRDEVEKAKVTKKTEKKEWYKKWEKLDSDFKALAEKLGITDFTSATRLSQLSDSYFNGKKVENILADLNNDWTLDARDTMTWGLKTWAQFLEIYKQVWEPKAIDNLLKRAKLLNTTLWLGLDASKFTKEEIWKGNKELILLLQNIINKPGEDLYTLLEWIDLVKEYESAKTYAWEMLKEMDMQALRGIWLQTPENIQTGLAWALFEAYKRWVWIGGQMSFDQWVKWLSMNTWFQIRDGGKVVVWIWLDYKKKINLWKWLSNTSDASAWVFIPLWYGRPDVSGAIGLNEEVAKERITGKWVQHKLGMQAWATLMVPTMTPIIYVWPMWESDKAAWIEVAEQKLRWEMKDQIKNVLENVSSKAQANQNGSELDFSNQSIVEILKKELKAKAQESWVKEKDIDNVVDATFRLLLNYNKANLADENVRDMIAAGVADQYAMARSEARKGKISEKVHVSWANLWAFRVVGSPLVWIYAWLKVTKYDLDGYGGKNGERHVIDNSKETKQDGARTEKTLSVLNTRLGLAEGQGLKIVDGNIQIPKSILNRVKVSKSMEGLLVKDKNGNIIVSTLTKMGESIVAWVATQSRELFVGESKDKDWKDLNFVSLDAVKDDWFATDTAEMSEKNKELFYTPERVVEAINNLKNNTKNTYLEKFNPTKDDPDIKKIAEDSKKLSQDKKVRITIEWQTGWKFKMDVSEWEELWRWFEVKYKTKLDMFDSTAMNVAKEIYKEALNVKDPTVLNEVKHKPWDSWKNLEETYSNLVKNGPGENNNNEAAVKKAVQSIFSELDKKIKWAQFSGKLNGNLDNLTGDALIQTLMSIKNIFARSKQVRWWGENYEFKRPSGREKEMKAIIGERYNILNTLESNEEVKKNPNAIRRYKSLFEATSKYVENKSEFKQKSAKAEALGNTVGFNLWDKTNPENPLFNPEIYNPEVDLNDLERNFWFTPEARKGLHKRAMWLFAKNPALINPALESLWINTSQITPGNLEKIVNDGEISITPDNTCQLTLDIWWKKVTLNAWMRFWFFTQCVNHTIILNEITAESDGTKVTFSSWVWENGRYVEQDKSSIEARRTAGGSVSATVHNGSEPEQPPKEQEREVWSENYNDGLHEPGEPGSTPWQNSIWPDEDPADVDF